MFQICIADNDHSLHVDTNLIEPFNATVDSHWMFIGEITVDSASLLCLRARIAACIDNLDFPLFKKALEMRRTYLCKKYGDL